MAHNDKSTTVGEDFFESREGAADAGIVGYVAVFVQRHIEVNANDGFVTIEIEIVDCHDVVV